MIILDNTKSLITLLNDPSNGLGKPSIISGYVYEELNGEYEIQFDISTEDEHFNDINVGSIVREIAGPDDDWQMFRIYEISKPFNRICTVKGQHISYDLNKAVVLPFTSVGAVNTINALTSNAINLSDFAFETTITDTTTSFSIDKPMYLRECIGKIIETFNAEVMWSDLVVSLLKQRSKNSGVRVAYGKNLTNFKQDESIANVYTSVLGYAKVGDQITVGNVYDKVQTSPQRIKIVDFSKKYDEDTPPTTQSLTNDASQYAQSNNIEIPEVNLEISFIPLYQTEEYKNLNYEPIDLGDTLTVDYSLLGVSANARVISRKWDIVYKRYLSLDLGNAKPNLNTAVMSIVNDKLNNM